MWQAAAIVVSSIFGAVGLTVAGIILGYRAIIRALL